MPYGVPEKIVERISLRGRNHVAADLEFGGVIVSDLAHPAPDAPPFQDRRGTGFSTQDLGNVVAATDAVEEPQGVPQIALAGGIGADQDRQGAEVHRRFPEALEVGNLDFFQHGKRANLTIRIVAPNLYLCLRRPSKNELFDLHRVPSGDTFPLHPRWC